MLTLVGTLSFVGAVLIYPGWSWARRRRPELSSWPLVLPLAGTILWTFLNEIGLGVPGIRNVPAEMLGVSIAAIVTGYMKFFYFDHKFANRLSTILAFAIVAVITLAFRLFTPQL